MDMVKYILGILIISNSVLASNMQTFLKSCGYGTGIGALVGIASLAFEDEPGARMNNVARGASLGLYAGIGYGLYAASEDPGSVPFVQVEPLLNQKKLDGIKVSVLNISF